MVLIWLGAKVQNFVLRRLYMFSIDSFFIEMFPELNSRVTSAMRIHGVEAIDGARKSTVV